MRTRPAGATPEAKIVFGGWVGARLVAVADVVRHWPEAGTVHIGLLLVRRDDQGRGTGRRVQELLDEAARSWSGVERWRIGVVQTNSEVEGFWTALGYRPTGETKQYEYGTVKSTVRIFTRPLE